MGIRSRIADWLIEKRTFNSDDPILTILLKQNPVTREKAMNIPGFAGCIRFITQTVASLPVKLYRDTGGQIEEIRGDNRVKLLNDDTGDVLNGYQFKQSLTEDLLIEGGGYAYINRNRNKVESIHYVDRKSISFLPGTDPIYKNCKIAVNGVAYRDFDFIKATKSSKDGVQGSGILKENSLPLAVAYNTLKYENALVKRGGNNRGFLKAEKKLTEPALEELRKRWEEYSKADEETLGVMVLNAGLEFKETSATPEQLQISQRKKDLTAEICGLFGVPMSVINGNPTDEEYNAAVKVSVVPVLEAIEAALNHDLLLESEKDEHSFRFDTKALIRGTSTEKRYAAYKEGITSNLLQIDEARYMEKLPPLGLTFIKLGLQDVLYDPKEKSVFVPNTGMSGSVNAPGTKSSSEGDSDMPTEERSDNNYIQLPNGKMNGSKSKKLKQALHDAETDIKDLDYERGYIIDKAGNVVHIEDGDAHSVNPPPQLVKDNIFTHNHPSGACNLTLEDVKSTIKNDGREIRAVTRDGRFVSLERGEKGWNGALADEMRKAGYGHLGMMQRANKIAMERYGRGKYTNNQVMQIVAGEVSAAANKWLSDNASKYGATFTEGNI